MSQLRVAILGAGYFSQFHLGSWTRMPEVSVVGCCDQDIAKAEATGHPAYDDLAQMLSDKDIDLLDIILPPPGHAAAIRMAIEAGVKTIICQKPFCATATEAEAMADLAAQSDVTLVVHENFRFQPWYRALKTALADGTLGTLQQVTFRLRPGDGQGPGAYLDRQPYFQKMPRFLVHETAVHWIDTFRYLLGAPKAVYADLRRVNPVIAGEDAGIILFDHPGGVRALFDGNRNLDHAATNHRCTMGEALVEGTDGTITLRGDGSLWHRTFGTLEERNLFPALEVQSFGGDCVHALQSHVVRHVMQGGPLENAAADYLRVIRIEEAVYRSAETGQKLRLEGL